MIYVFLGIFCFRDIDLNLKRMRVSPVELLIQKTLVLISIKYVPVDLIAISILFYEHL